MNDLVSMKQLINERHEILDHYLDRRTKFLIKYGAT